VSPLFGPWLTHAPGTMNGVTVHPLPHLTILPGTQRVLFLVELDPATTLLAWRPRRFLEGLKAASDLLGFVDLQREEDELDELLHWSGNV
jgi:hypothetical protein